MILVSIFISYFVGGLWLTYYVILNHILGILQFVLNFTQNYQFVVVIAMLCRFNDIITVTNAVQLEQAKCSKYRGFFCNLLLFDFIIPKL